MSKRALRFGRAEHLIGVVHEARDDQPRLATGVLLWNTGISHRVGPQRLNVELADALAERGLTVLRFDLARLGDSDDTQEKISLQESSSRDLADALELLVNEYQVDEVILLGLCSSAVDAYYFARTEPRVKGLLMVDTFVYPTLNHKLLYFWQRLTSMQRWARFFKRRLLPLPASDAPALVDSFEPNYPHPLQARDDLRAMLERGVEMLVIYTGGFAPYFSHKGQFAEMLGADEFGRHLELLHWPATDHLFTMLEDRQLLKNTLIGWLQKHFLDNEPHTPEILPSATPLGDVQPEVMDRPSPPLLDDDEATPPRSPAQELTQVPTSKVEITIQTPASEAIIKNEGEKEAGLCAVILQVYCGLLVPLVPEANDSFFDLGGTSLLAIRAAGLLSERLQLPVSVVDIYAAPQAEALAQLLGGAERPAAPTLANDSQPPALDDGIAIIGIACQVPGAKNWRELWQLICEGGSGISSFSPDELDPSLPAELTSHPSYVPARGVIAGDYFDAPFFAMNRREALFTDPQQRVLLQTCWQALEDAGYSRARRDLRVAVYAGVGGNTYLSRNIMQGHAEPHSEEEYLALLANDKDYVATRIAYALDLKGPAVSVHTACSTSLVAVIEAAKTLLLGDADLALAGAASVNAPLASGHLYQEGGIFSRDASCKPFAADATGTMFSDGSAVVVLKKLSAAQRDGDTIYAVIRSWGLNNDGSAKSSFAAPSVQGQAAAIRQALDRAAWSAQSISYVECHGTATPIGDPIEIEGLRRAFNLSAPAATPCALGSIKANIGHLTAAAGTVGLIKAALVLRENWIPPARGAYPLNPALRLAQSPFFIPEQAQILSAASPRRAGISSFGVGGTNAHVLLEEAPPRAAAPLALDADDPWSVLSWTARDTAVCEAMASELQSVLSADSTAHQALGSTLFRDREVFAFRQTAVGYDAESLTQAFSSLPAASAEDAAQALIFLFPGQGSQYPQMGMGLAAVWPRFARHYFKALDLFQELCQLPLRSLLASEQPEAATRLQETLYTQPALFSIEWALAYSLREAGLAPHALIGHSIGELAAACLAEVFTLEQAVRIVHARASAMQAAPAGAMLAVRSNWEKIAPLLDKQLSLAAYNGPDAVVIAGPIDLIQAAAQQLRAAGFANRQLETSHAFHSPMMDAILDRYAAVFKGIALQAPRIPIYSSVSGLLLTAAEAQSVDYWVQQIRQPVNFLAAVQAAAQVAQAHFFELGPKAALSRLVPQILGRELGMAFPSLGEGQSAAEASGFTQAIARLWNHGYQIFTPPSLPRVSAPAYPFIGERLWLAPKSKSLSAEQRHDTQRAPTQPAAASSSAVDPALLAQLQVLLGDLAGLSVQELGTTRTWTTLGLDSLLLTQWALKLQKQFAIKLHLQQLQGPLCHLEALALHIASIPSARPRIENPHRVAPSLQAVAVAKEGSSEIHQMLERQTQLMEQQLKLFEQLLKRENQTVITAPFWESLPIDGEVDLHTDEGSMRLPLYKGAFMAKDHRGQPALFVEDPHARGQFWQVTPLPGSSPKLQSCVAQNLKIS